MEGCVFQFFSLLSKFHAIDIETFASCAVGVGGASTLATPTTHSVSRTTRWLG